MNVVTDVSSYIKQSKRSGVEEQQEIVNNRKNEETMDVIEGGEQVKTDCGVNVADSIFTQPDEVTEKNEQVMLVL